MDEDLKRKRVLKMRRMIDRFGMLNRVSDNEKSAVLAVEMEVYFEKCLEQYFIEGKHFENAQWEKTI